MKVEEFFAKYEDDEQMMSQMFAAIKGREHPGGIPGQTRRCRRTRWQEERTE